jgi:sulfatase maturation enzyme AslB (radical SAM superfamily)
MDRWFLDWQPVFSDTSIPIFFSGLPGRLLFYTPGWLAVVPSNLADPFLEALHSDSQGIFSQADGLRLRADQARRASMDLHSNQFHPHCLTLYLNNSCNLNCSYCFSNPGLKVPVHLSLKILKSAAEIVAGNCQSSHLPMTVVFHGGGEPTLDQALIFQALDWLDDMAAPLALPLFKYLATNGVMSAGLAAQLAARFDLIGLSCDGPQDIQDRQRPLQRKGRSTSNFFVEQTAQVVHGVGTPLHVRVTITPDSLHRQAEIADYICRVLKPQEIHVEPIYAGGRANPGCSFGADQADAYVSEFFEAQKVAKQYGVNCSASGSRPSDIHSAYCHVWRNVLNLTPEGVATACFALSQAEDVRKRDVKLGDWDEISGGFKLDIPRADEIIRKLAKEPQACINCFNRYHCVRQCPDSCLLETDVQTGGFRCRVQALMTDTLIQKYADHLWSESALSGEITDGPVGWGFNY